MARIFSRNEYYYHWQMKGILSFAVLYSNYLSDSINSEEFLDILRQHENLDNICYNMGVAIYYL